MASSTSITSSHLNQPIDQYTLYLHLSILLYLYLFIYMQVEEKEDKENLSELI